MDRFYGNTSGRFTSPDRGDARLYLPTTLNRYVYSLADPLNYADSDGKFISGPKTPEPESPISPGAREVLEELQKSKQRPDINPNTRKPNVGNVSPCDVSNDENWAKLNFIKTYSGDAQVLSNLTGLSASFILAWTALESGYGVGLNKLPGATTLAQTQNNFLGLKSQDWVGANSANCGAGADLDYACFGFYGNGTGGSLSLIPSVWAALTSGSGHYLGAALEAQAKKGSTSFDIGNALAKEGFNPFSARPASGHIQVDIRPRLRHSSLAP